MQDRILIVEDDPETAAAVRAVVEDLGCGAVHVETLAAGLAEAAGDYRVIVLDRMLPGGDGVDAIARIRAGGATALILVHNHPSGDPSPSRADVEMTREIGQAATMLGIVLHDHLIIGNGRHYSFRREGHL